MTMLMMTAAAALAYGGLASISMTMDRHYTAMHGRGKNKNPQTRLRLRLFGWLGIVFSLAACIGVSGWTMGPLFWCGMLTASALLLMVLLQYDPRKAIRLAMFCYPVAVLAVLL